MRKLLVAAALGAVALPSVPAGAQYWGGGYRDYRGYNNEVRREERECQRELRRADSRREYRRELRECRREIAEARRYERYGYGHRQPRYGFGVSVGYAPAYRGRYWDGYGWRYRW